MGTPDAQDRLVSYGDATYAYAPGGELQEKVVGADTTRYTYDQLGNLTRVDLPDGSVVEYVIDGRNRRVGRKVDGALTHGWLYHDQLSPVAELDSAGAVLTRYVYGTRANVPDYLVRGGTTYRIVSDHQGSVRLVVEVATGAVVQRIDYDAFGRVSLDTNPGFQPFGFAGGLYDGDSGLVRFGARDYDPYIGRWTSKDPIGFAGGDPNLYGYVLRDPVNLIDREGTWIMPAVGALLGGAFAAKSAYDQTCGDWSATLEAFGVGAAAGALSSIGAGLVSSVVMGAVGGMLGQAGADAVAGVDGPFSIHNPNPGRSAVAGAAGGMAAHFLSLGLGAPGPANELLSSFAGAMVAGDLSNRINQQVATCICPTP